MRKRNSNARLVVFWVKLPNPKYIARPYEQIQYPGQRVQINVKLVPAACIVDDAKVQSLLLLTSIQDFAI